MLKRQRKIAILLSFLFLFSIFFGICPVRAEKEDPAETDELTPGGSQGGLNEKYGNVILKKSAMEQLQKAGEKADYKKPVPVQLLIAQTIQILLETVGMVFIGLIVASGYWRFTAAGDESKIEKSNKTIIASVIGLAIVLSAFAITKFVAIRIQNAAQEEQKYEIENDPYNIP